jgi:hypothetical protein
MTYEAMCKALGDGFVTYEKEAKRFDFHCDRDCVG